MKTNRWEEFQKANPKTSLFVDPLLRVTTEQPREDMYGSPRYAFDLPGSWRREQMVRVQPEGSLWRVWYSVISIADDKQRFSLRDLPNSYHVTPREELPTNVWLSKGISPTVITTEFTTNGKRVFDPKVYMDQAICKPDTYGGAHRALEEAEKRGMFVEEMDDRTQVVAHILRLARLKSGAGQLEKGIGLLGATQNRILSLLGTQASIPIPRITQHEGFECYVVPDPERPGWYHAPFGDKNHSIHSAEVLPTKYTAPGRRQLDAFVGRQLRLVTSGMEHRYGMDKVRQVCRYHNRQFAA